MKILVTGGAGFVGSSLAIRYKQNNPEAEVIALDNLKRRGSELNLPRLRAHDIKFVHGDIRNKEDLFSVGEVNTILECSAEPSVLAGYDSSPEYVVNTNLLGTIQCLELARHYKSDVIFLSTSRVYPIEKINSLNFKESETRFEWEDDQPLQGASSKGLTEEFSLIGTRSLYGATKLASELIIQEYAEMYGFNAVIDRCGVIAGPWQMGKVDQGFMVFWVANHLWNKPLAYFGYGGKGKQVRDILHIDDLFDLIEIQLKNTAKYSGQIFNVGGGNNCSVSLCELTKLCQKFTGNTIPINAVLEDRTADIRVYLTDNSKVTSSTQWQPKRTAENIVSDIFDWIKENQQQLKTVLG